MSTTYAEPRLNALDEVPWVEMTGDLSRAFAEFATAADGRISKRHVARKVVVGTYLAEVGTGRPVRLADRDETALDWAAFGALERSQNIPLVANEADDEAYLEATSGYEPPVAKPLPIE